MENIQTTYKQGTLTLGSYRDDWNGCIQLLNDLTKYFIDVKKYSTKMKVKNFSKLLHIKYEDSTRINPAFFPLIEFAMGGGVKSTKSKKWQNFEDMVNLPSPIDKFTDAKKRKWVNVNAVYPNYEKQGIIAINSLDTESKIEGFENIKIDGDIRNWTADIANVLNIITQFSSSNFTFLAYELRAIKYLTTEILANTFQHAFHKKGRSDIGIFLNEETKVLILTISDRGLSIPGSVRQSFKGNKKMMKKSDATLIEWSLGKGNTSKNEYKQGGMGLYRVKRIVDTAEGEFGIKSSWGSIYNKNKKIERVSSYYGVGGTIIYIKIDLHKIKQEELEMTKEQFENMKEMFI